MTFPFSNHNYQLRFWMAAAGIDPDEDVRLVVLPPPYMVDSLTSGHVDGFCVGAPWNSMAVEHGVGRILHFGCDIVACACEKVLAVREAWARANPETVRRLLRALHRAAAYLAEPQNRAEAAATLAARRRIDVPLEIIRRTLDGRMRLAPNGPERRSPNYLVLGGPGVTRPDPVQAAWLYAQMVRWRQAPMTGDLLLAAKAVFRPDLYDDALGIGERTPAVPADGLGAFAGPAFNATDIAAHLSVWAAEPRV
jgi:NitT/TauT family transport system ATP-binding protein